METVEYIKRVHKPACIAGEVGDSEELPRKVALRLQGEGYVEIKGVKKNDAVDEGTDRKRKRPRNGGDSGS